MRDGRTLGVIPARLGSERLPRKPLHPLAGRPLLEWVWRRVSSIDTFDSVVVATDSTEIASACAAWGAPVEMTADTHESGTSRIAELVTRPGYREYDIVVNVQGDEPFVEAAHVAAAVAEVRRGFDVGTVAAPVETLAAWRDPDVVKVARRPDGAALYFSRSPIPYRRGGDPSAAELGGEPYLRHIGLYAYGRGVLERWPSLPAAPLESIERLEQLRALSAGLTIGVGLVSGGAPGVDTLLDAERAERKLRGEHET